MWTRLFSIYCITPNSYCKLFTSLHFSKRDQTMKKFKIFNDTRRFIPLSNFVNEVNFQPLFQPYCTGNYSVKCVKGKLFTKVLLIFPWFVIVAGGIHTNTVKSYWNKCKTKIKREKGICKPSYLDKFCGGKDGVIAMRQLLTTHCQTYIYSCQVFFTLSSLWGSVAGFQHACNYIIKSTFYITDF